MSEERFQQAIRDMRVLDLPGPLVAEARRARQMEVEMAERFSLWQKRANNFEAEALRYAQNVDHWKSRADKAEAERDTAREQYRLAHIDSMQATAEAADLLREIDDALAVVRAPDSTNDGGRANLADEMRQLSRNFTAAVEDQVKTEARADKAEAERDAARKWAEESVREVEARERLLTCAFCGHEFPPGTPPSQHEALERHVAECPKHPMRVAEARADRLAEALRRIAWCCHGHNSAVCEEPERCLECQDSRDTARAALAEEK